MIELNQFQAQQLLSFFGGHDSQVCVAHCEQGHSGPGLYAHCADYPEEGAIFLEREDAAMEQAAKTAAVIHDPALLQELA